jgi:hypothetical protein
VAAVLERALLDAVGPAARQADRDDALAWFGSDDDAPFWFRWVAAQLDFDAQCTAVAAPEAPRVESKVRNAA